MAHIWSAYQDQEIQEKPVWKNRKFFKRTHDAVNVIRFKAHVTHNIFAHNIEIKI